MSVDSKILRALREEGSVSGTELSEKLGISRAAVWARIEELRSLGYDIVASPHRGYQLLSSPDLLHSDDLMARTGPTKVMGRDIRVFQSTTSTNDVVEKLARDGVREGVVVFAESQSRGRGRLGRKWMSARGKGLWFSVLLRPDISPQAATRLTVTAAVSLVRAIRAETGLVPEIKWPNDILINGRKVAGILTEMSAEVDHVKYLILGIGMDVNQSRDEFPKEIARTATSLKLVKGEQISRASLASRVLRELDRDYERLCGGRATEIFQEWQKLCGTLGKDVVILHGEREIEGRAESVDDDGALLLRLANGDLERIVGGDVSLKKK